MKRRWWLTLAVASVAGLALIATACGGDDDDDADDGGDTETPAAADTPAATPDDGDDTDYENGGSSGELADLIEKFAEATFTAEYDVTGFTAGEDVGFTDPAFLILKDGRDRIRFDVSGTLEGEDVAIIIIDNAGEGGFCVRGDIGLGIEGEGACFQGGPFEDQFGGITQNFEELQSTDFEILDESEREIAGQDARCFKLRDPADGTENDVCVTDDGGLLYMSDGETTFEATSFSDEVDASEFELPYPVQEIPGLQ